MKESAKRILALVLSFVMIFTSLPIVADAKQEPKQLEIDGKDIIYVGQTTVYNVINGKNNNSYKWEISNSDIATYEIVKNHNNENVKEVNVTGIKAGEVKLSVLHDNNRKAEKTIIVKDKNQITEDVEVTWGETKELEIITKELDWELSNNNCVAQTERTNEVANIDYERHLFRSNCNSVKGLNIGTCTFTAEDDENKYTVNVTVVANYEINLYVDESKNIEASGVVLNQDANLYGWEIFDQSIATGKIVDLGAFKSKKYFVTGVSEGTTYLLKDGMNDYVFQINVTKRPYFKDVVLTINDGTPQRVIIGSNQTGIKIDEDEDISDDFADYKNNYLETYEDNNFVYTLNENSSSVEVATDFDENNNTKLVTVKAVYDKERKCSQTVFVELLDGDAKNISRKEALKNGYSYQQNGKKYYFNENIGEKDTVDMKKYLVESFEKDNTRYILDTQNTKVNVGKFDNNGHRDVIITPIYNKVKVVVTFMYENTKLYEATISSKDKKLTKEQKDAATQAAKQFEEDDETHSFKFKKFVDAQGAEVIIDGPQGKAFNENTTLYADFETKLKGSKFVKFGYYDKDRNFVKVANDKRVENEELKNYKSNDEKASFIQTKFANDINNNIVKEITFSNQEIKVIYNVLTYQAKFICDNEEVKTDDTIYYVVDRNMDEVKEDEENANKIINDNELDKNFIIENTTDVAKYTKRFDIVATATELLKDIKLFFTKGFVDPVEVVHQLYFHDVEIDGVQQNYKEEIKTETVEKPENKANLYEMYKALDLGDYVLDNVNGNNEAITKDGDKVVFNYRARMIRVTYKVLGLDGKEDKTKGYTKASYVKFNEFNVKDEASLKALVDKVIEDKDDIEGYKFKEAEKLDGNKINELSRKYPARPIGSNNQNDWSDTNVVEITLVYEADKQYFFEHEYEYVDMGDYHKHICTLCEYVDKDDSKHVYPVGPGTTWLTRHTCEKCKHVQEGINETFKMDLYEGFVEMKNTSEHLANAINTNASQVTNALMESNSYEAAVAAALEKEPGASFAEEEPSKMVEAIMNALENKNNLTFEKDILSISNVYYEANVDELWYNLTIVLNNNIGKFNQVEIKNDLRYDSVYNTIAQEVRRQKETANYKLPEKPMVAILGEDGKPLSPDKAALEYGKVYDVFACFVDGDNTEAYEFKGKVHLYHGSSKKKKKNTDLPDGLLPQGGAGIADLRTNRPDDMLTRSEFIGVLSEIFSVLDTENYKDFTDINGDANELAIKKLSSFGIVQGYCEDTFGPNDFITREQMYTFIARALKFSGKASQLTDEQINAALSKVLDNENVADWAKDGVATSIEKELVNETEKAQDTIKRVEAADKLEKFAAILFTEEEEIK